MRSRGGLHRAGARRRHRAGDRRELGRETADRSALIRLRGGAGYPLRAKAPAVRELGDGWDELEIPYGHGLDAWLVEFGPDVVVLEPAELRADVVDRLRAVAKG